MPAAESLLDLFGRGQNVRNVRFFRFSERRRDANNDRITLGQEEDPGPLIRDRFGARYVFSDNQHHDFFDHARASGWFDIVYEDTECTIMYIRDEKLAENPLGEPGDE